jgi:hypothetical protein
VSNLAKVGLRQTFELETRNKYTKVNCEVGLSVDGRELPSMAVLGAALEEATQLIQDRVTESYKEVPARVPDNVSQITNSTQVNGPTEHSVKAPEPSSPSHEVEPVPFGATKPWDIGKQ